MFLETNSKRQSEYNEEASRACEQLSNNLAHIMMQLSLNARLESDAQSQAASHALELKQAQDQVRALQGQVAQLIEKTENMVPKTLFQKTEVSRACAEAEKLQLEESLERTTKAHLQLQEAYDIISKEHSNVKTLYSSLVGSLELPNELSDDAPQTPRPSWDDAAATLSCDLKDLGASTQQRVRSLCSMVTSLDVAQRKLKLKSSFLPPFMQALGVSEDVLSQLKYNGRVRNCLWTHQQVQATVADMWREKKELEDAGETKSLHDIWSASLKATHGKGLGAEKAYNFWAGMLRYGERDPELQKVLQVLEGSLDPATLVLLNDSVNNVAKAASELRDADFRDCYIADDILKAVMLKYPTKSIEALTKLEFALKEDILNVGGLQDVTESLLAGHLEPGEKLLEFTKLLRNQMWYEREEHFLDIQRQIQLAIWEPGKEISASEFKSSRDLGEAAIQSRENVRHSLQAVDPELPAVELEKLLQHGFDRDEVVTLGTFLNRVKFSCELKKYSVPAD